MNYVKTTANLSERESAEQGLERKFAKNLGVYRGFSPCVGCWGCNTLAKSKKMKDAGASFISSPTAWARRTRSARLQDEVAVNQAHARLVGYLHYCITFGIFNHLEKFHFISGLAVNVNVVLSVTHHALEFVAGVVLTVLFDERLCNIGYL